MKKVYLIQSLTTGMYKIGVSKNPQQRIKNLQTGNSEELKIVNTFESEYATKIESALKNFYSFLNTKGEWFELSLEEEVNFKKKCGEIENNIQILKSNGNIFI